MESVLHTEFKKSLKVKWLVLCLYLFQVMNTAPVVYCRDHEVSCIRGTGFQSAPPLEGLNVPEDGFSRTGNHHL